MSDRKFRTLLPNTDRRPQSRERNEELRVIRGTRGIPGTVAPFRAWRGSRDLVAQSPKFHAPTVANCAAAKSSLAQRLGTDTHAPAEPPRRITDIERTNGVPLLGRAKFLDGSREVASLSHKLFRGKHLGRQLSSRARRQAEFFSFWRKLILPIIVLWVKEQQHEGEEGQSGRSPAGHA